MITRPTLIIDSSICKANIEEMAVKANQHQVAFRPHFKTHQSAIIGDWFKENGVNKITVSSLSMAMFFAKQGWQDITVAFPVNILEIDLINSLAKNITLNLVVENKESISFLEQHLDKIVNLYLKIDTGYHRTGIAWNNTEEIFQLAKKITKSKKLTFTGLLAHAGHTYNANSKKEILEIHTDTCQKLAALKIEMSDLYPNLICSVGDTPSCSLANDFLGIDEIRPGNFVFYDAMQLEIGSCSIKQIAAVAACPVVAKHKDRKEIVIYGGGVHLSKELGKSEKFGSHYGLVAKKENNHFNGLEDLVYVKKLSQEHGIIHCTDSFFNKINIGDIIFIIPVHSCLVANLLKENTKII